MKLLSIDPGYKNYAVYIERVDTNSICNPKPYEVLYVEHMNISEYVGKDYTEQVYNALSSIDDMIHDCSNVIIECQESTNIVSSLIANVTKMYMHAKYPVIKTCFVSAAMKTKYLAHKVNSKASKAAKYTARKRFVMQRYSDVFKDNEYIQNHILLNIDKYDDDADAWAQAQAWKCYHT